VTRRQREKTTQRRRAQRLRVLVVACLVALAACRGPASEQIAENPLPAVVLPDLSRLAAPVQQQIQGQFAAATRIIENPGVSPSERAGAYASLGKLFLAATLADEAELCYRHAQALAADDMRWPYMLGHVSLTKGEPAKAATAFERALNLRPDDVPALVWLASARLDEGRFETAESLFLKALTLQPSSAAAAFGAGRAALARQAYKEAVERFERALAIQSGATAVHYPLAMAYRALGDRANADVHLSRRGEVWPALADPIRDQQDEPLESVTLYERRGVQALGAQDWASAIAAFRKVLELDPNDAALRHRLATALYGAGDQLAAAREFDEVLRRHPGYLKAHISLGMLHNLNGRYPEAIDRFAAALQVDRNSPEARLGLAEALRVSGRPEASIGHYDEAVKLDPAVPEAWIGGAMALITLRRTADAREWLARAERVHPNQAKLRELEGMLR
jgi:tetratricopeptide (TPR) repeat protein